MKITQKYKLVSMGLGIYCIFLVQAQQKIIKFQKEFEIAFPFTLTLNTSYLKVVLEKSLGNKIGITAYAEVDDAAHPIRIQNALNFWKIDVSQARNSMYIVSKTPLRRRDLEEVTGANNLKLLSDNRSIIISNTLIREGIQSSYKHRNLSATSTSAGYDSVLDFLLGMAYADHNAKLNPSVLYPAINPNELQHLATQLMLDLQRGNKPSKNCQERNPLSHNKVKKIIKIAIPQHVALHLNLRHGELHIDVPVTNLKASLSHTKFYANYINGDQTAIEAAYSPVSVRHWNQGKLVLKYVKDCRIQKVKQLSLQVDSSIATIQHVSKTLAISANFGSVKVYQLSDFFTAFDAMIEHSDLSVQLPKRSFNLMYTGSHSRLKIPEHIPTKIRRNFNNLFVNGHQGNRNTSKNLMIQTKYSEVELK